MVAYLVVTILLALASLVQAQPWTSMTPGTWYAYPSSTAISVRQAANTYPDWNGTSSAFYDQCEFGPTSNIGFTAIMSAWSGGAYDPTNKKLYIWGGGHGDYCGNEVLSFNLVTGAWTRETNRWLYVDQGTAPNSYTDSVFEQPYGVYSIDAALSGPALQQPRSTHTYNALQWVPTRNGFCAFGSPSSSHGSAITPASHLMFCWDQTSKQWFNQGSVDSSIYSTMRGEYTAADPRDSSVFWVHSSTYGAALYKCTAPAGQSSISCVRKAPYQDINLERSAVMDSQGRLWVIGGAITSPSTYGHVPTQMGTFDLTNNLQGADVVNVATTGDTAMEDVAAPGVCYLPGADRIVAWSGGADIYVLNPTTLVWTKRTPHASNTVTPTANTFNGTYGRMRCDESQGILFGVNAVNQSVYLYKLPTDLANPPAHTLTLTNNGPITVPLATAQTVGEGATVTATASGSNLLVTFSAPSAGSPTFTPTTCTPSGGAQQCTTTFAYPPNPSAVPGTFPVVVTGTDSFPSTAQTTVTFIVQAAPTSFGNIAALQHDGPATPEQLSIWLPFTGTVPETVKAEVRYRAAGSSTWITGHRMSRIRPELSQTPANSLVVTAGFAWPIIGLTPGTSYETEVTLTDTATSATEVRTGTFTTRALPPATGPANKFATVGMGGDALRSLINTLVPGDVLELPAGTYNVNDARIQIDVSGTEALPIVIRGASKTGTIITRSTPDIIFYLVYGNHIRIENMTIQGGGVDTGTAANNVAFYAWSNTRPQNIVMRDLNISGVDKCLIGTAMDKVMFYNNVCYGNNQWNATFLTDNRTWNDDATNMPGTGNVAFQNTYKGFGDCASFAFGGSPDVLNAGIWFYRNDYDICGDDLVEFDHGFRNIGFYDNRAYNVMTCLSIDPVYGGPIIYARNICVNAGRQVFKLTDGNSNYHIFNNTFISTDKNQSAQAGILSFNGGYDANNWFAGNPQSHFSHVNNIHVYCEGTGRQLYWETTLWHVEQGTGTLDWTHNSWAVGSDARFTWQPSTYTNLADIQANIPSTVPLFGSATKRFTSDTTTNTCQPFAATLAMGASYLTYQGTKYDLTVDAGETPKNSGLVVANITDGYSGAAPTRGAVIDGRPAVTFGVQGGGGSPPGIPATPSNLRTTQAPTQTLVQLAWDFTSVPANLELGFRLYRKLQASGSYGAPIATIAAGTLVYSDNTVAAGTAYHYAVSAYNGTGESSPTGNLAVTTPSSGGPTGLIPILSYWPAYGVSDQNLSPFLEQAVLAKTSHQGLAPSYCLATRGSLKCDQTQTDMDREMQIAAAAGIKAFSFVWYNNRSANLGPAGDSGFQVSYNLFKSSTRTDVSYCITAQLGYLGATDFASSTTNWHANVQALATLMNESRYQKVLTNRPILFLYWFDSDITTYFNNSVANLGTAITYLRTQTTNSPYVVLVKAGTGPTAHTRVTTSGADALGDYSWNLTATSASSSRTYATQDAGIQAYWTTLASQGDKIVPVLQVAGGKIPRFDAPPLWNAGVYFQRMGQLLSWIRGTPAQIAAGQFTAVGAYINTNPSIVDSKALYIFNAYESSLGGYPILPSIADPPQTQPPYTAGANNGLTNLLNAIGPVLYSFR